MFYAPLGNMRICEYPPSLYPPDDVTYEKMSGGLKKISKYGPGGIFRICQYTLPPDDVTFGNSLM